MQSKAPFTTAGLGLLTRDLLRDSLRNALWHSFRDAGYSGDESLKLAEIAIGLVHQSLELANKAYKLHIEAISNLQHVGLKP